MISRLLEARRQGRGKPHDQVAELRERVLFRNACTISAPSREEIATRVTSASCVDSHNALTLLEWRARAQVWAWYDEEPDEMRPWHSNDTPNWSTHSTWLAPQALKYFPLFPKAFLKRGEVGRADAVPVVFDDVDMQLEWSIVQRSNLIYSVNGLFPFDALLLDEPYLQCHQCGGSAERSADTLYACEACRGFLLCGHCRNSDIAIDATWNCFGAGFCEHAVEFACAAGHPLCALHHEAAACLVCAGLHPDGHRREHACVAFPARATVDDISASAWGPYARFGHPSAWVPFARAAYWHASRGRLPSTLTRFFWRMARLDASLSDELDAPLDAHVRECFAHELASTLGYEEARARQLARELYASFAPFLGSARRVDDALFLVQCNPEGCAPHGSIAMAWQRLSAFSDDVQWHVTEISRDWHGFLALLEAWQTSDHPYFAQFLLDTHPEWDMLTNDRMPDT